ncbi:MFS transporter [Phytoactinopolyspora halotolerans]|uniref:MFS transporter n=1 Tax=Phytoactinopolyspora halotolerans TaxID=1981512 RepID=A0A6L9S7X8_9ACTN|nr:MFS transporter [Phytoactinopolyspora halotolerans]NEE01219.1 MFS transporter [Phytoactinopolyspora halotolerans]
MTTATAERAGTHAWLGLAVLALPTALLGLDVTLLHLALPTLAADVRPTSTQALWIIDIYGFLIAGLLITMGSLGDRIGRRRLLMIGTAAFCAASVWAAYSSTPEMLIAARAALGVAGATLMPSTLALIGNMFRDSRQRALAIGVWATMFAAGMAMGPLVGGLLLDRFWWGSAFLVAVPVTGVLLIAAPLVLPEYRSSHHGPIDLLSVALSLAAVLPLVYAVKHATTHGFDTQTTATVLIGTTCSALFVRRQLRLESPLLDMRLFADRAFSAALSILLFGLVGVGGLMLLVTQYLQLVEGLAPLQAGAWMGLPALAMLAAAIGGPLAARRIRPGVVMGFTLLLSVGGYALLSQLDPGAVGVAVAGFALVYLGLGAIAALGTDLVVGATPPSRAGSAAAMSETVQELGIAVGIATLGSAASAVYRSQMSGTTIPDGVPGDVAHATEDSLSAAISVQHHLPTDVVQAATEAFTAGLNVAAALAGTVIVAVAAVAVVALRRIPPAGPQP